MEGISGCGLGLRREFLSDIEKFHTKPNWLEIVPENWIQTPKKYLKEFEKTVANHPIVCHGLSLSIGRREKKKKGKEHEKKKVKNHKQ